MPLEDFLRITRARFLDELPAHLRERLTKYSQNELDEILEQRAIATSAEEALRMLPGTKI